MTMMMAGPSRALSGDRPMLLWRETHGWRVSAGFVDLFAVPLAGGEPAGRRRFLGRLGVGQILLPLPPAEEDFALLACGGQDAQAVPLDDAPTAADLDAWIAALCAPLTTAPPPGVVRPLPEGTHALPPGEVISALGHDPLWLTVDGGGLEPPGALPVLAGPLRLRVGEDGARLRLRRTRDLLAEGTLPAALEAFHAAVLPLLAATLRQRQAETDAALGARAARGRRLLAHGYAALAEVIAPSGRLAAPPPPSGGDVALAVVRQVAAVLAVPVQAPSQMVPLPGPHGAVGAVLRASGLRARVVLLRDRWWTAEGQPLIATREADGTPLALLPGPDGYRLWDAASGQAVPMTAARAATLAVQALAVYPRFVQRAGLAARDVFALARRGAGGDALRLLALAVGSAVLALLVPVASSLLVDEVIPAADRDQLRLLVGGLIVAAFGTTCFELTKGLTLLRLQSRLDAQLQAALFDRLLRLPAAFFKRHTAGDLTDRVLGVQAIRQILAGATITSLLGGVFSTVSLIMLFTYSLPLAGLAVGLALVSAAVLAGLSLLQVRRERRLAQVRGRVEGLVLQLITGVGKLAAAAARDRAMAHWAGAYAEQKRRALAARAAERMQAVFMAAFPPLAHVAVFLAVAALAKQAAADAALAGITGQEVKDAMGTGAFMGFTAALGQFLAGLNQAVRSLGNALSAVPLWERSRPLLAEPTEDAGERHAPGRLDGGIEFAGVGFSYVHDGPSVLKGLSATIAPGEFVALVGPSGGGKSTVLRLLLGLEHAAEGEIFLDGKALSRLDLAQVRAQMGVVLQDSRILPGDVFHNIAGESGCRLDEAWEAAAAVGLDTDIRAMPMGMHTVLMEGGATLSGGQRQRLAIARALARRPRILLLDEATSALDNRTQATVTASLARLNLTRVVIAHRLSTITEVDRILVIDQGRVVQSGPYADLIARPGLFADMARRQVL